MSQFKGIAGYPLVLLLIFRGFCSVWNRYLITAKNRNLPIGNLTWRDEVFSRAAAFTFPIGFIGASPGAAAAYQRGAVAVVVVDVATVCLLGGIALLPRGRIPLRRLLYGIAWYPFSLVVLWELGADSQGLLFLLTAVIVNTVIFGRRSGYLTLVGNVVVCMFLGIVIHLGYSTELASIYSISQWFAVSISLFIPSIVLCLLISTVTEDLEIKISAERKLLKLLQTEKFELSRSLQEIKRYVKDQKDLSFATAHHLKEPLKLIDSFTELIREEIDISLNKKTPVYLSYISMSVDRSFQLLSSLRVYTDVGTKGSAEVLDMYDLIEVTMEHYRQSVSGTFIIQSDRCPVHVRGIESELRYLVTELLDNAVYFTRVGEEPTVIVEITIKDGVWNIAVADSGIGIAQENLERVFGLFSKLEFSDIDRPGMGLATCRRIAESHGGSLSMKINHRQGVTVEVQLASVVKKPHNQLGIT